jgi:hypothetical protein
MASYGQCYGDGSREATWARVLEAHYREITEEPMPERIRDLLQQLHAAERRIDQQN